MNIAKTVECREKYLVQHFSQAFVLIWSNQCICNKIRPWTISIKWDFTFVLKPGGFLNIFGSIFFFLLSLVYQQIICQRPTMMPTPFHLNRTNASIIPFSTLVEQNVKLLFTSRCVHLVFIVHWWAWEIPEKCCEVSTHFSINTIKVGLSRSQNKCVYIAVSPLWVLVWVLAYSFILIMDCK